MLFLRKNENNYWNKNNKAIIKETIKQQYKKVTPRKMNNYFSVKLIVIYCFRKTENKDSEPHLFLSITFFVSLILTIVFIFSINHQILLRIFKNYFSIN